MCVERCLCLERARRSRSVMSARTVPGKRGAGGPGSVLCAGGEGGKRTRLSACRCPMSLSFPSCPDLSLSFSGRAGHHTHTPQRGATGARRLKRAKADGFGDAAGTARPALGGAGGCCLLSGRAGGRGVPIGTDGAAARGAAEHNKKRGTARHLCQIAAQGPRRRGRAHELPQNTLQGAHFLDCPPSQLVTGNGSLPCPPPVLSMSWPCPRNVLAMSCSGPADAPWAGEAGRGDNNAGGKGVHGRGARTRAPEPQSASTSATTGAREPHLSTFERHIYFSTLSGLGSCLSSRAAQLHWYLHLLLGSPPFTSYSSCSPHFLHAHTNALTIAYKTHPNRHLLIHQC